MSYIEMLKDEDMHVVPYVLIFTASEPRDPLRFARHLRAFGRLHVLLRQLDTYCIDQDLVD